jgi:trans-aconitate methyltransferase
MDARELKLPVIFDSIFSNAVLHWIPEKDIVIRKMHTHLKKDGKLVLEFGGKGNNQTMLNALRSTLRARGHHKNAEINFWYYPSIGEYACELEKQNFRVLRAEHFDRFTELKGENGLKDWFIMFAERFFKDISPEEKSEILDTIQNNLRATHYVNGKWYADYKRIRIVAVKE